MSAAQARARRGRRPRGHVRGGRCPGVVGVVLAGGRGSRMGGDKPRQLLAGTPLLRYPIAALARAGLPVAVVTKPGCSLPRPLPPAVRVLLEGDSDHHPLCGIVHALRTLEAEAIVVLACDMPFVPARLIAALAATAGVAAVATCSGLAPFPARWERSCLPHLEEMLARGASLRTALATAGCRALPFARGVTAGADACDVTSGVSLVKTALFDIDTPRDLARAATLCTAAPTAALAGLQEPVSALSR